MAFLYRGLFAVVKAVFKAAPGFLGGFDGADELEICGRLHRGVSSGLKTPEACDAYLFNYFDRRTVFVGGVLVTVAAYYLLPFLRLVTEVAVRVRDRCVRRDAAKENDRFDLALKEALGYIKTVILADASVVLPEHKVALIAAKVERLDAYRHRLPSAVSTEADKKDYLKRRSYKRSTTDAVVQRPESE